MNSTAQAIQKFMRSKEEEIVNFLTQLAEIESPSVVPEAQQKVLARLSDVFYRLDYRVDWIPGKDTGGHLFAAPAASTSRRPVQLIIGHCDTVWPIGTLEKMPVRAAGNRLSGPGVFDMKAGLVQIVYALTALKALGIEPDVEPQVFINSDEEIGSGESTPHIIRLAKAAERAYILEPALGPKGKLKTARKGIGQFKITIKGKPAHAGLDPERGASAILELSHLIQRLYSLADSDRGITINVGMVNGGLRPNVVAPNGEAIVDVRILSQQDADPVKKAIQAIKPVTKGVKISVRGGFGRPPLERTPRNQALVERARTAAASLNLRLDEGLAGGGSDGNTTSQYTATLDGLGPVGDGAHAEHEFIYIDKLVERCGLLAMLLLLSPAETG